MATICGKNQTLAGLPDILQEVAAAGEDFDPHCTTEIVRPCRRSPTLPTLRKPLAPLTPLRELPPAAENHAAAQHAAGSSTLQQRELLHRSKETTSSVRVFVHRIMTYHLRTNPINSFAHQS